MRSSHGHLGAYSKALVSTWALIDWSHNDAALIQEMFCWHRFIAAKLMFMKYRVHSCQHVSDSIRRSVSVHGGGEEMLACFIPTLILTTMLGVHLYVKCAHGF